LATEDSFPKETCPLITNGLIFFPNERKVFTDLTSGGRRTICEPQCKGMISLTDIPFEYSEKHRSLYGNYGLIIDREWAISKGTPKGNYVGPYLLTDIECL